MVTTKKSGKGKKLGRDALGHPVPLKTKAVKAFDASPAKKAQRHGEVQRGAMGEERKSARSGKR